MAPHRIIDVESPEAQAARWEAGIRAEFLKSARKRVAELAEAVIPPEARPSFLAMSLDSQLAGIAVLAGATGDRRLRDWAISTKELVLRAGPGPAR